MASPRRSISPSRPIPEESRLEDALRRADTLLFESLKSEEAARRKHRRTVMYAFAGGATVITAAVWIALAVANATGPQLTSLPAMPPGAGPSLEGTMLAANAPATPAPPTRGAPAAAPGAAPAAEKPDALPTYKAGDAVQVKWGGMWRDAKIVERDGDIYLVNYNTRTNNLNEWVTIDRVRLPGSARDIEYATPNRPNVKPDAAARAAGVENYKRSVGGGGAAPVANRRAGGGRGAAEEPPAQNAGDLSEVRVAELTNTWEYAPDAPAAAALKPGPITLEALGVSTFEKVDAILFSTGGKAAVGVLNTPPGQPYQCKMDLLDPVAGRRVRTYTLPPETRALALSPDGSRVALGTAKFGFGHNSQVDVCTLGADGKLTPVASFTPYAALDGPARDVEWAFMPDNDHVLTASSRAKLILWKLPEAKAVWALDGALATHAVVSPGGKYVIASTQNGTFAVETLTGKGAGKLAGDVSTGVLAIHPAGKLLASASNGRVKVIDLATNAPVADVFLQPGVIATHLAWAGDKFLLLGNRYLLDIDKGLVVWDYQSDGVSNTASFGNYTWYVTAPRGASRGATPTFAGVTLPHPAALNAAKAVDDKAYAIKSGVKVTLEVNTNGQGDAAKVTEALTKRLEENGMTVAPGQPVKLLASITPGKSHEIQYRMFGSPGARTVNVTDLQVSLKFTVNDKTAWEASTLAGAPVFLQIKEGQTVQQAVEEAQASAWKFFTNAELPKRMPAPREPLGYGKSPLNASR